MEELVIRLGAVMKIPARIAPHTTLDRSVNSGDSSPLDMQESCVTANLQPLNVLLAISGSAIKCRGLLGRAHEVRWFR